LAWEIFITLDLQPKELGLANNGIPKIKG